jgi:N-acetylneuraminate lyase
LLLLASAVVTPLRIDGLVAAVLTPFNADGSVDLTTIPAQAEWLQETGVKWVFVCGTTGESLKLNTTERLHITEEWLRVSPQFSIQVIVHVGDESIETARLLAAHAEAHGAAAIGAMPPVFFRPSSTDALAMTMGAIASAAPNTPFYYYHIPSQTNVFFSDGMYGLALAMEARGVDTFCGVKYTGLYQYPGFMDAARLAAYKNGKFEVFSGRDELMVESLAVGIIGFVGSQYNMLGDMYNAIIAASAANDLTTARALQLLANEFISIWQDVSSGVNGFKYVFNVVPQGVQVGDSRLPSVPIPASDVTKLTNSIQQWCIGSHQVKGWPAQARLCKGF